MLGAEVKPGAVLVVSQTYFRKAHRVVFEIGVKLAQVLWRKIAPKESEDADYQLLFLADDLLVDGKFDLAKILLDFADTTLAKRHATEWYRLKFLVNRALAYRLSGDKGKCAEILASQDWTAAGDAFKLAEHVLSERFEAAATLMKKIGAASEPHKGDYLNSPMYSEFRKNPLFARTFGGIFGAESHEERLLVSEPSESRPS